MRKLIVALVVLVALLVAADRAAVAVAESKISDRIAASYGLPAKPGVTIQGFPFLTQVVSGNYRQIDISAGQVSVGRIGLTHLHARFDGVHAALSQLLHGQMSAVTASRASGSAVIPYPQLAAWLPSGIKVSRAGRDLRFSGSVRVFGVKLPLSGTAAPSVTGAGIRVRPQSFRIGRGAGLPVSAVEDRLGVVVPLTNLPLHLRVDTVAVTSSGLRADASATNVQFSSTP